MERFGIFVNDGKRANRRPERESEPGTVRQVKYMTQTRLVSPPEAMNIRCFAVHEHFSRMQN